MPREGHDYDFITKLPAAKDFNPRAPRGARPFNQSAELNVLYIFQSTCPARGTTIPTSIAKVTTLFQSTCPARGTTPRPPIHRIKGTDFNPRAPRGARLGSAPRGYCSFEFQSTCPARGTTCCKPPGARNCTISIHVPREGHDADFMLLAPDDNISIHVPREGHDLMRRHIRTRVHYFNPRAPRGARQQTCTIFSCRFAQELQISR